MTYIYCISLFKHPIFPPSQCVVYSMRCSSFYISLKLFHQGTFLIWVTESSFRFLNHSARSSLAGGLSVDFIRFMSIQFSHHVLFSLSITIFFKIKNHLFHWIATQHKLHGFNYCNSIYLTRFQVNSINYVLRSKLLTHSISNNCQASLSKL